MNHYLQAVNRLTLIHWLSAAQLEMFIRFSGVFIQCFINLYHHISSCHTSVFYFFIFYYKNKSNICFLFKIFILVEVDFGLWFRFSNVIFIFTRAFFLIVFEASQMG
ncbi:expressed protein [Phakopsora pachyrhizi]|uniref:Expressed protein n=1 Tax=Phakopsora pachyrhizi TaxID=170000 RepID=A0AAV0BE64_PHAPC|nr:expressed protein [Phakopsora pachyrhizi]